MCSRAPVCNMIAPQMCTRESDHSVQQSSMALPLQSVTAGAHERELVRDARPLVGVGGCESGCAAMSSRSGRTMSGRPGVYRRHCIAAFTKHVLPARRQQPDHVWQRQSIPCLRHVCHASTLLILASSMWSQGTACPR